MSPLRRFDTLVFLLLGLSCAGPSGIETVGEQVRESRERVEAEEQARRRSAFLADVNAWRSRLAEREASVGTSSRTRSSTVGERNERLR